jgi:hypothetical protein
MLVYLCRRPIPADQIVAGHNAAVLQSALEEGDAATARWVLERIRAEVYGSAADKKVMAELRKAATEAQSARVVVTIGGTKPRKQAAG